MSPELEAAIDRARKHVMTPQEKFEQRVSFVYGQQDWSSGRARSKDEIRQSLIRIHGTPELDDLLRLQSAVTNAMYAVCIAPATQSRIDSVIEVAVNIAIGATVSLVAQVVIFPMYGIHVGAGAHLGIVAAFTVVSVARQYVIRRICNGRSPWMFIKGKLL